jgi:hypothetical protein
MDVDVGVCPVCGSDKVKKLIEKIIVLEGRIKKLEEKK